MIGTELAQRYALIDELGRGGMGVVYRAQDQLLEREVAIKTIPPGRFTPEAEEQFQREARIVAQLDHPGVLPIYDFGIHHHTFYFVMPLVEGETLRKLIRRRSLSVTESLEIVAQAAEALDYSHSRGVIHLDIKPENLMVSKERDELRVRLMDFGVAWDRSESRITASGPVMGTISYMSPEQVLGEGVESRSDLYSLGAVLHDCLVGEPPYVGTPLRVAYRIIQEQPIPFADRGVDVDPAVEALVRSCLDRKPERRPPNGKELAKRLRELSLGLSGAVSLPEKARHAVRPELSPLIGREDEWRALRRGFDTALEGYCSVTLISGEIGVGKTRLLEELDLYCRAPHLQKQGVRVLRGRFEGGTALQGLSELISHELRRRTAPLPDDPEMGELAAGLCAQFPSLADHEQLAAAAESAPTTSRSWTYDSAGAVDLFEVLARTMIKLSGGEPRVCLLEHLEDAEIAVPALRYVVRRLGAAPFFFAATCSPSSIEPGHPLRLWMQSAASDPRLEILELGSLRRDDFRRWIEWLIGNAKLRDEMVDQLFRITEGNPYFAQEIVRSLSESEELHPDEAGYWILQRRPGRPDSLPRTVRQAIDRRIDRLTQQQQEVLRIAAVIGRTFTERDLKRLVGDQIDLDELLDTLLTRGLLREDRQMRGDRLSFTSTVLRESLEQSLSRRRRRALHRRYAEDLEKRFADRPQRVLARLVEHFSAAEAAPETVRYGLLLAKTALDARSPDEALTAVEAASELLDDEDVPQRERRRGDLHQMRAQALFCLGRMNRAAAAAEDAVEQFSLLDNVERIAETSLLATEIHWQMRQVEQARKTVLRGIEAARRGGDLTTRKRLLTLGTTLANLRGAFSEALVYREERQALDPPAATGVRSGGSLISALRHRVTSLDPADLRLAEEYEIAACMFETLLAADADGSVVLGLCEAWHASEGADSYFFELRRDVRFSDDVLLTAQQVKTSFERTASRAASAPLALTAIRGYDAYRRKLNDEIEGIVVLGEHRLRIDLSEPLPIFPSLLTNLRAAVVRETELTVNPVIGTGPFRLAARNPDSIRLVRHAAHRRPAQLDELEILTGLASEKTTEGMRQGRIDLGKDLSPGDVEILLNHPDVRPRIVEAPKKNIYFVLFNLKGRIAQRAEVRRALMAVSVQDLVWRTLGRYAQPAAGIIPPGVFGHDLGRRRALVSRDEAVALLAAAGLETPIRLQAMIHPLFASRYEEMTKALTDEWSNLGVEIDRRRSDISSFRSSLEDSDGIDVLFCRWIADYDDPDNFTYELFHSRDGIFRNYFSSPQTDRWLETARQEKEPALRQMLYQKFEDQLLARCVLLPLFHDVEHRLALPHVQSLHLQNTPPYVNYPEVQVGARTPAAAQQDALNVPIGARPNLLDPIASTLAEHHEVLSCIHEPLTRVNESADVIPWIAESVTPQDGGRFWHVRLRPEARFHSGRPVEARDVRFTFERLLRSPRREIHFPALPILGARRFRDQDRRDDGRDHLEGLRIVSERQIVFELNHPMQRFPSLLSHPASVILPEDVGSFDATNWQDGNIGCGAFRILRFEPGVRLVLGRNPHYWRPEEPRAETLTFHFGIDREGMSAGLRDGRFSLISSVSSEQAQALEGDARFAEGIHQAPRLSTVFLVLNPASEVFADRDARRRFLQEIRLQSVLQAAGAWTQPARSLIPPGLLGGERPPPLAGAADPGPGPRRLRAAVSPPWANDHHRLWRAIEAEIREQGVDLQTRTCPADRILQLAREGDVDLLGLRWAAGFPDPDSFAGALLHSRDGRFAGLLGDEKLDELIEQGRRENDPSLRQMIYLEIEERLAEEAWIQPLVYEQSYRFCRPELEGIRFGLTIPVVFYAELGHR